MAVSAAVVAAKLATTAVTASKGKIVQIVVYPLIGMAVLVIALTTMLLPPEEDSPYSIAVKELTDETGISGELSMAGVRLLHMFFIGMDREASVNEIKEFIEEYLVIQAVDEETGERYERFLSTSECIERIKEVPFSFEDDVLSLIQFAFEQGFDTDSTTPPTAPSPLLPIPPGSLSSPCDGYYSSHWGYRTHPVSGVYELHTGIDVAGAWHRPIYSVASGTVVTTNIKKSGYGNYVQIKHSIDGVVFYSFYAHLSRIDIRQGDTVAAGQQIGLEGGDQQLDPNPGTTSGHHLHLELRTSPNNKSTVNPYPYLPLK